MLIDGIHVPLTAPFYRDGRSYLRKLEHNVGRYSLGPVAGLVLLPPAGETVSDAETAEALKAVAEFAAPEKVLIAGVAEDNVAAALTLAEQAAAHGFDGLLVAAPAWASPGERMLFFNAVADAVALPVVLWSGSEALPVEAIGELAGHSNIVGIYDAGLTVERYRAIAAATSEVKREVTVTTIFAPVTRRMKAAAAVPAATGAATFVSVESLSGGGAALAVAPPVASMRTRTKVVGFQVMAAGDVLGLVDLLGAGVAGAMPRLAACVPQGVHEIYAAFKDGDPALALEKAERLLAADALMRELGVAGVKYGCDLNGYYGGAPRLPRLPLGGVDRERVERVLSAVRS